MKNISPHVTIYKFPITAMSSITTRLTGLYLSGIFVGSGLCCLVGIDPIEKYKSLEKIPKKIVNYSVLFPITYHSLGGIRHFVWDKYPQMLQNTKVAKSSYALIGISLCSTIVIEKLI